MAAKSRQAFTRQTGAKVEGLTPMKLMQVSLAPGVKDFVTNCEWFKREAGARALLV